MHSEVARKDQTLHPAAEGPAAEAMARAGTLLDEAAGLVRERDRRARLRTNWHGEMPRLRSLVDSALERDARLRKSWVSLIAPPDGKGIRRVLEEVAVVLKHTNRYLEEIRNPRAGAALDPTSSVADGLAKFTLSWRPEPEDPAVWLEGLKLRLELARSAIDAVKAGLAHPHIEHDIKARLLVSWALIDALDEASPECGPEAWSSIQDLIGHWLQEAGFSVRLLREPDAESAAFADAVEEIATTADEPTVVTRTGFVIFDQSDRTRRATLRTGKRRSPNVGEVLVALVRELGKASRSGIASSIGPSTNGPGAWILSAQDFANLDAGGHLLWAHRDLIDGLRSLDPDWPGWSRWEELGRSLKVEGSPGPSLAEVIRDLDRRATDGGPWSNAYRRLRESLVEVAGLSGIPIDREADSQTFPAPRVAAISPHRPRTVYVRFKRDEQGNRFREERLRSDWPEDEAGNEVLAWVNAHLDRPPATFPSLHTWWQALADLPAKPRDAKTARDAARDAFRREVQTETGLADFHAFALDALRTPVSDPGRWLALLRQHSWITLVPVPTENGLRMPPDANLEDLDPALVSFKGKEQTPGGPSGFVAEDGARFAPFVRHARATFCLSPGQANRCERARMLSCASRDLREPWRANLEPLAREAFLESIRAGRGVAKPAGDLATRRNALDLVQKMSLALEELADPRLVNFMQLLRLYVDSIGYTMVPGPEDWKSSTNELKNYQDSHLIKVLVGFNGQIPLGRTRLTALGLIKNDKDTILLIEMAKALQSAGEAPRGWSDLNHALQSARGEWADKIRRELKNWPREWMTGEQSHRKPRVIELFTVAWEVRVDASSRESRKQTDEIREAVFQLVRQNYEASELIEFRISDPLNSSNELDREVIKSKSNRYFVTLVKRPGLRVGGDVWVRAQVER